MKSILIFITKHLLSIHSGTTMAIKLKSSMVLAASVSPVVYFLTHIEIWVRLNIPAISIISLAIAVDHLVGSYLHAKVRKDFDWIKNIVGLLTKIALCVCSFSLFEGMNFFLKDAEFIQTYFKIVTSLTVFMWPAGSAFVNMAEITGGVFPPIGWIDKIKNFNQNLNLKTFKDGTSDDSTFPNRD